MTAVRIDTGNRPRVTGRAEAEEPMILIQDLMLHYGDKPALKGISMQVPKNRVTAFIGPSGCGKTTLLRCLNRMNDLVTACGSPVGSWSAAATCTIARWT